MIDLQYNPNINTLLFPMTQAPIGYSYPFLQCCSTSFLDNLTGFQNYLNYVEEKLGTGLGS